MAVVLNTQKYATPTQIMWTIDPSVMSRETSVQVPLAGVNGYMCWTSPCQTFQVQYRHRKRYVPSAAILLDDSGADVWTAWSAWAGDTDEDIDFSTPTIKPSDYRIATTPITFSYDVTTYDLIEYEIRVRTFNSDLEVSEWGSSVTRVYFMPQVTTVSATEAGNNRYDLAVDTNWERRLNTARYKVMGAKEYDFPPGLDGDQSATAVVTQQALSFYSGYVAFEDLDLYGDGATPVEYDAGCGIVFRKPSQYQKARPCFPITSHTPQTVPAYTTAITESQELTTLKVTTASAVTSVAMSVSWTDIRGVEFSELLEVTDDGTGKVWTGYLAYPPLDTEITWHYSITYNGDWADDTKKFTVDSDGLCLLDGEDDHFQIRYNPQVGFNYENEHELVAIAGRRDPVSRYGEHSKREVSLKGLILNPDFDASYGDMWLEDAETLDRSHDYILRLPGGYRQRVSIDSSDLSGDVGSSGKWLEVSLNMTEVE